MVFQRAPPEVIGFGAMISIPSWVRSSQLSMFSGLPGRTMNVTTEFVTIPSYLSFSQPGSTLPSSTSVSTSGASDSATTSAGSPFTTASRCSPEDPYD
jgi:hypothetical protein